MTDRILIQRIAVYAYHGVHPEEEKLGQRFFVSLDCAIDLSEAGRNDDWTKTACYQKLTEIVAKAATERRFHIIEALAETVAAEILATFPRIEQVTVRVDKPAAPVPAIIDAVAVEITRRRMG